MENSTRCRLCLEDITSTIEIFAGDFTDAIQTLTGLKLCPNDGLPQTACLQCYRDVKTAMLTRYQIIQSHNYLLKEIGIETKIENDNKETKKCNELENITPSFSNTDILSAVVSERVPIVNSNQGLSIENQESSCSDKLVEVKLELDSDEVDDSQDGSFHEYVDVNSLKSDEDSIPKETLSPEMGSIEDDGSSYSKSQDTITENCNSIYNSVITAKPNIPCNVKTKAVEEILKKSIPAGLDLKKYRVTVALEKIDDIQTNESKSNIKTEGINNNCKKPREVTAKKKYNPPRKGRGVKFLRKPNFKIETNQPSSNSENYTATDLSNPSGNLLKRGENTNLTANTSLLIKNIDEDVILSRKPDFMVGEFSSEPPPLAPLPTNDSKSISATSGSNFSKINICEDVVKNAIQPVGLKPSDPLLVTTSLTTTNSLEDTTKSVETNIKTVDTSLSVKNIGSDLILRKPIININSSNSPTDSLETENFNKAVVFIKNPEVKVVRNNQLQYIFIKQPESLKSPENVIRIPDTNRSGESIGKGVIIPNIIQNNTVATIQFRPILPKQIKCVINSAGTSTVSTNPLKQVENISNNSIDLNLSSKNGDNNIIKLGPVQLDSCVVSKYTSESLKNTLNKVKSSNNTTGSNKTNFNSLKERKGKGVVFIRKSETTNQGQKSSCRKALTKQYESFLKSLINEEKAACPICKKEIAANETLPYSLYPKMERHLKCHDKKVMFVKKTYKKTELVTSALTRYSSFLKTLVNKNKATCPICKKELKAGWKNPYSVLPNMKNHFSNHTLTERSSPESSTCRICRKIFKNEKVLKTHNTLVHSESPNQHICEQCGQSFKIKYFLTCHLKKHKGIMDYECYICGKKFFNKQRIQNHISVTHLKKKRFTCEYCAKTFGRTTQFKQHLLIHTNTYPQKCEVCGKGFKLKQTLRTHMKGIHGIEEEKTVFCHICDKGFANQYGLTAHLNSRVHGLQKCNYCSEFITIEHLVRHLREVHGIHSADNSVDNNVASSKESQDVV